MYFANYFLCVIDSEAQLFVNKRRFGRPKGWQTDQNRRSYHLRGEQSVEPHLYK